MAWGIQGKDRDVDRRSWSMERGGQIRRRGQIRRGGQVRRRGGNTSSGREGKGRDVEDEVDYLLNPSLASFREIL